MKQVTHNKPVTVDKKKDKPRSQQRMFRRRVTHHHACDCREEWFEKVEKANSILRSAMYDILELESGTLPATVVAVFAENALTNSALESPPNDQAER